jgi:hypothetical protein
MIGTEYTIRSTVEIFPMDNPWIYVSVPKKYVEMFADFMDRGLVAITATLGESTWNTSLMPKGDGTLFIPLSAKNRKKEKIKIGDTVTVRFQLRQR